MSSRERSGVDSPRPRPRPRPRRPARSGREPVELVAVYDADGGPIGETKYVLGRLLGRTHCALCDITHSPVRRKPEWDRMVADLGVPVRLRHRNEQRADIARVSREHGLPLVAARLADGDVVVLLLPGDLEVLGSSVPAFAGRVRAALGELARGSESAEGEVRGGSARAGPEPAARPARISEGGAP